MAEGDGSTSKSGKATSSVEEPRDEFEDFMSDLEGFMSDGAGSAERVKVAPKPPPSVPSSLKVPVAPPRPGPPSGRLAGAPAPRPAPADLSFGSLAAPKVPREAAGLTEALPPLPAPPEPPPSAKTQSQRPTLVPREEIISKLVAELHEPEEEPTFGNDPVVAFPTSNRGKPRVPFPKSNMDDMPTVPPPNLRPAELDAAARAQEEALLAEANKHEPARDGVPYAAATARAGNESLGVSRASVPTIPPGLRPRRSGRYVIAVLTICVAAGGVAWLVLEPKSAFTLARTAPSANADNPPARPQPAPSVVIPPGVLPPAGATAAQLAALPAAAPGASTVPATGAPPVSTASAASSAANAPTGTASVPPAPPRARSKRSPNGEDNPY